jgi:hypothetical protein
LVAIPNLSEQGAPPFLDSVVYGYAPPDDGGAGSADGGIVRNGVHAGDRFTYTRYYADGPLTLLGQYLSWDCVDPQNEPGEASRSCSAAACDGSYVEGRIGIL